MESFVNSIFRFFLPSEISLKTEKILKNIALILGILSAVAIIFDWYPLTMFLSFPFCLIWIYCAWLHTEPQLKWVNLIFLVIYSYGITLYFFGVWNLIFFNSNLESQSNFKEKQIIYPKYFFKIFLMSGLDNFRLNVRFSVCTKPFVICTNTINSQIGDFQIN